ncbi:phosphatidylethanolamine N-methyltransferase family protein [Stieleria sp. TO1_6]|uniref:phosphatidylethanolamine N-methyltransferase family protein n=1 Tax=Stieleria tagensis TaxID=2956795 RepID=UPI00209B5937|nr:phosphatidylethanolamine N-methyltransferase family protein [Stieleria tagensis]MCO8121210.1 phosphatidylethanolamine N-methyltransferase family protein [Stieleria tagensis]
MMQLKTPALPGLSLQDDLRRGVMDVGQTVQRTGGLAAEIGSPWVRICQGFLRCHRRPLNIALHLITTPLGILGLYALAGVISPIAMLAMVCLQGLLVFRLAPVGVATVHACLIAGLAALAWHLQWGMAGALSALVLGYVGQEISHWITGESTFQRSYQGQANWLGKFAEHTVLLLPVLLVLARRPNQSPLRILVARNAVLVTKLNSQQHHRDFARIVDWVLQEQPVVTHSHHWWQSDLDDEPGRAFDRLCEDAQLKSMIRSFHGTGYTVDSVPAMNELYVTGPPKKTSSDTVFYRGHVDGPWSVFPGARLYRCMVALNHNNQVTTHYPMSGIDYRCPESHRLENGDVVAFDFNRELHFITRQADPPQIQPRMNLKLHFVAYPRALPWYGRLLQRLTTVYDIRARTLFLGTINPSSRWETVKANWVLGWTKVFELAVRHLGWSNLVYVVSVVVVGLVLGNVTLVIAATSFVHYGIYIGTLQERSRISFGTFRRDAIFFKSIAMAQLFVLFAVHFDGQFLALAAVVSGFLLAGYAAAVLGLPRTYFSSELGFDSPRRVQRFPYGVIPHPMILGAMGGIAAMAIVPAMRQDYGWLIAGHLACYLLVLGQEIWHFNRQSRPEDRRRCC